MGLSPFKCLKAIFLFTTGVWQPHNLEELPPPPLPSHSANVHHHTMHVYDMNHAPSSLHDGDEESVPGVFGAILSSQEDSHQEPIRAGCTRARYRWVSTCLGVMLYSSCVGWITIVEMLKRGKHELFYAALTTGIIWTCTACCYALDKYFQHKRHLQHDSFILWSAVAAVTYAHGLALLQKLTLLSSLVAVPPGVTFAMWTVSMWINVQNRGVPV